MSKDVCVLPWVLETHGKLAYFVAKRYRRSRDQDFEDFVQEARMGIVEAAKTWRPGAGAKFYTYAVAGARNRCSGLADKEKRKGFRLVPMAMQGCMSLVSLDLATDDGQRFSEVIAAKPNETWDAEPFNMILRMLPPKEQTMLRMKFVEGRLDREIGVTFGLSRQRVSSWLREVINCIRINAPELAELLA